MKKKFKYIVEQKWLWSELDEPSQRTWKPDIYQKRVIVSVWKGVNDTMCFELLPANEVIGFDVYHCLLDEIDDIMKTTRSVLRNHMGGCVTNFETILDTSVFDMLKLLQLSVEIC